MVQDVRLREGRSRGEEQTTSIVYQWDATSLIERAVVQGIYDAPTGQQLLLALRPRLHVGFVEHSLRRLEGVI
jgi:hypothetical protein